MTLKNFIKIFNVNNNGSVYLCETKNGQWLVRSVAGKWVKIKNDDFTLADLQKDLNQFEKLGTVVKETDVIVDNSSQIINLVK